MKTLFKDLYKKKRLDMEIERALESNDFSKQMAVTKKLLSHIMSNREADKWMSSPNKFFYNQVPRRLIQKGQFLELINWIRWKMEIFNQGGGF